MGTDECCWKSDRADLLGCAVRGLFPRRPCDPGAPADPDASMTITARDGQCRIPNWGRAQYDGVWTGCRSQATGTTRLFNVRGGKMPYGGKGCVVNSTLRVTRRADRCDRPLPYIYSNAEKNNIFFIVFHCFSLCFIVFHCFSLVFIVPVEKWVIV